MKIIKSGSLFSYVQCDIEVPKSLREAFANFPPVFRYINAGRDHIGPIMKEYAAKEGLLIEPRRMQISSYVLENGTTITPLVLFFLDLEMVCKEIYRFVQYTPMKCFNTFVQSATKARRELDEIRKASVVAETLELLANSSYGYQIIDWSRHTSTNYLNDGRTHGAIIKPLFKRLCSLNDQLYEVELDNSETEHRKLILIWSFILQDAKVRTLGLYCKSVDNYCDVTKFEELEMHLDSLYLELSELFFDCIRPAMKKEWNSPGTGD